MKINFQEWRMPIISLLGILALALILRLINLTLLPVFADEAIYIRWSQIMSSEPTLRFLPLSDGKQPLYMWILMVIVDKFSDPLFVGRLISVGAGLGTLLGVFAQSFAIFKSKRAALLSAFIWAISPFAFFFDRLALVDSTLAFFGVWTAVLAVITAKTGRLDMALITGFFLGGALLTKSPALFFVLLLPSTLLFVAVKKKNTLNKYFKHLALLLPSAVVGYAMYNILRLGPNFHMIASRNADYVYPISSILNTPFDPLVPHFHRSIEWMWLMGPAGLLALLIVGVIINVRKNPREILFLLLWGVGPILAGAAFAKVFTARYIFYCLPFLVVLSGSAFLSLNKFKRVLVALLLLFITQSFLFIYALYTNIANAPLPTSERTGFLEEWTAGDGIKEVSLYLKNEHEKDPSRQIVVGTEGYFGTLPDGLQMYLEGIPNMVTIGVGLNINQLPSQLVASVESGNKTYLVINKSRLTGEPGKMGLKLIMEFLKTPRTLGTHDYVQKGPQEVLYFFEVGEIKP